MEFRFVAASAALLRFVSLFIQNDFGSCSISVFFLARLHLNAFFNLRLKPHGGERPSYSKLPPKAKDLMSMGLAVDLPGPLRPSITPCIAAGRSSGSTQGRQPAHQISKHVHPFMHPHECTPLGRAACVAG